MGVATGLVAGRRLSVVSLFCLAIWRERYRWVGLVSSGLAGSVCCVALIRCGWLGSHGLVQVGLAG